MYIIQYIIQKHLNVLLFASATNLINQFILLAHACIQMASPFYVCMRSNPVFQSALLVFAYVF